MLYSRNYARNFVTLKQDSSEYNLASHESTGRCIIEIKRDSGRFTVYVQGLKKDFYNIYAVNCTKGSSIGVNIGKINVDDSGKAEIKKEFNPDNVLNSGMKIDDFDVIFISTVNPNILNPILIGFTSKVVEWKNNFTYYSSKEENKNNQELKSENTFENIEEKENEKNEENIENIENIENDIRDIEDIKDNLEDVENIEDKNDNSENIENVKKDAEDIENIKNDLENIEDKKDINSVSSLKEKALNDSNNFNDIISKFKEELEKIEAEVAMSEESASVEKDVSSVNSNFNYNDSDPFFGIKYIFSNNISMSPFQKQKKDVKWVRISGNELVLLPNPIWVYINNPFICCAEKKYRHLILGKYKENDEENYVLGVPGVFFPDYRLEADLQGFKQFKCCDDKMPSEGDYGYWILHIEKGEF